MIQYAHCYDLSYIIYLRDDGCEHLVILRTTCCDGTSAHACCGIRSERNSERFDQAINRGLCALQKKLFTIGPEDLGDGQVIFEWSPKGDFIAVAGTKVLLQGV